MTMSAPTPRIAILHAGLGSAGPTDSLSQAAVDAVEGHGAAADLLDLRVDRVLPYGEEGSDGAEALRQRLDTAAGVIISFPVYNFNMNATLKAAIEHCGPVMSGKVVGLMATAGGRFGYMSMLSVVQSLMLDLRMWVVPRQVYAVTEDFSDGHLVSDEVRRRVEQLAGATVDMARRLQIELP